MNSAVRTFVQMMLATMLLCLFCVPLHADDGDYVLLIGGLDGPDPDVYPVTETVVRWIESIIGPESGIEIRTHDRIVQLDEFYGFYMEAIEMGADKVVVGLYDIEGSDVVLRLASLGVSIGGVAPDCSLEIDEESIASLFNVDLLNDQSSPPGTFRYFAHSLAATSYYKCGRFEEALTEINYAIEFSAGISDVELSGAYSYRGYLLGSVFNNPEAAVADFDIALELDSTNYKALSDRAYALSLLNSSETAFEAHNSRIELYPDSAEAYYDRGVFLYEMGYIEDAFSDFKYAVELAPDNPHYGYDLGLCYAYMYDFDNAIDAFNNVIDRNPEYVSAYIDLALIYMEQDDYETTKQYLVEALEIDDSVPRVYSVLALTCMYLRELESALQYVNDGSQLDPTNQNFPKLAGMIYMRMGDFDSALSEYELAYEMIMTYHNGIDSTVDGLQNLLGMMGDLRDIAEMDSNSSDYYYARGFQLSEVDSYALAIIELNEAIRLDPENENAYYLRGMCCIETGDTDQARSDLETVIEMTPFSHRKRMAEQLLLQL